MPMNGSFARRWPVAGGIVLVVLPIWLFLEWNFSLDRFSLRLGFLVGLLSFPVLLRIYDYGFGEGDTEKAYRAMGLSFFLKGIILFGSYIVLNGIFNLSFREYMFPLFFLIFLLGFLAIYLARKQSDFSFTSNQNFHEA
jgi:hypothetical protein